ncbi:hypothetical protein SK128_000488, partial [Halocaridina rubra]
VLTGRCLALLGFLLITVTHVKGEKDTKESEANDDKKITPKISEEKAIGKEKFFVASYYTTTFIALSTITSQVPYYCVQTSANQGCQGRRLLRRKRRLSIDENVQDVNPLSSLDEAGASVAPAKDGVADPKSEKFFFTVWKTSTSTATVISTSTNKQVTISFSAWCTYAGFTTLPLCG